MITLLILLAAVFGVIIAYGFACDIRRWFRECRWLDEWLWDRDQRAALARLRDVYANPEAEQLERVWELPDAPNPRRLV